MTLNQTETAMSSTEASPQVMTPAVKEPAAA